MDDNPQAFIDAFWAAARDKVDAIRKDPTIDGKIDIDAILYAQGCQKDL